MADLQSATYNGFEATTTLAAQLPDSSNVGFDGDYIVKVQPLGTNSDGLSPYQMLGGILGQGCDGGPPGGVGVTGYGSPTQGTGVLGKGGVGFDFNEGFRHGAGGVGVNGIGGDGSSGNAVVAPGTGVLGQGGKAHFGEEPGAGVVGVSGDNTPIPDAAATSGRGGVFASGINPQLRLIPFTPSMVSSGNPQIPRPDVDGRPGDLLAITEPASSTGPPFPITTLWFCTSDPATPWKLVSLT